MAMKTPGVYVIEKSAFGNSIVEVATAVPAFIGYTEKADNNGISLKNVPWRISSMPEFTKYFGGAPSADLTTFHLTPIPKGTSGNGSSPVKRLAAAAGAGTSTPQPPAQPAVESEQASQTGTQSSEASKPAPSEPQAGGQAKVSGQSGQAPLAVTTAQEAATKTELVVHKEAPLATTAGIPKPVKAFSVNGSDYQVTRAQDPARQYLLYYSMVLFFQNGGGPCYIVSVGDYNDDIDKGDEGSGPDGQPGGLIGGIYLLLKEQEPTMVVMPDAVRLSKDQCTDVQQYALQHCQKTQSRVTILDVYDGFKDPKDPSGDWVQRFRDQIGINDLSYGMAYYPWLNTSVLSDKVVTYLNIDPADLTHLLTAEAQAFVKAANGTSNPAQPRPQPQEVIVRDWETLNQTPELLHKTLMQSSPAFKQAMTEVKKQLNLLPPSAAMAGVYSYVDGTAGVWKAPANVSLNSVVSPAVNISFEDQEGLNVDIHGKSINAIRSFIGEGVLVWGARTLDGNSLDWRYVSVRRTMIMLEQSIKQAAKAFVFENNVSTTWVTLKSMIRNFLTGIWKRGGLAGAAPDDAFQVFCGLGETMTPEDILEGILRITVLVAVTHPAEFIEITFQQQLQKS
jgi:uncharacterized protein